MLTDLLPAARITVHASTEPLDKGSALKMLAARLAEGAKVAPEDVERVLVEREALQSTGIGDGVAIPHGALGDVDAQWAALLIVPAGLDFDAIDGNKVTLLFALIGPKRATGEHLKTLARISRLLRSRGFRERLIAAPDGEEAYRLLVAEEGAGDR
jgi:PTS system nitrogen regulatory IIA component